MERPPLIGRGFQHGVTDCYSYIRDWYRVERGVELPQFVRDWDWWKLGDDLYAKGFASAGFTEAHDAPQRGDVLLYTVGSKVVNHGAIYEGGGVLSHHLATREPFDPNRLSTREAAARWERFRVHHLRYGGHNE
jgi:cell wall-associated NlpC family hydrolase